MSGKFTFFYINYVFPRQLCIFEMVEEGDSDGDGKINFDEFRTLLSPHYKPSSRGEIKLPVDLIHFSSTLNSH